MSCALFCLQQDTIELFQPKLPQNSSPDSISKWVGHFWSACSASESREDPSEKQDIETTDSCSEATLQTIDMPCPTYTRIDENSEEPLLSNTATGKIAILNLYEKISGEEKDDSIRHLMKDLKETIATYGPKHSMVVNRLISIGDYYFLKSKQFDKAIKCYQSAIDIYKLEECNDLEDLSDTFIKLGRSYLLGDQLEKSIKVFLCVRDIKLKQYGHANSEVAMIYEDISIAHAKVGNDTKMLKNLRAAFSCYRDCLGLSHIKSIQVLESIAAAHFCMGDQTEASGLMEEVVKLKKRRFGARDLELASSMLLWGICLDARGERQKCKRKLNEAFRILLSNSSLQNPQIPNFLIKIGNLFSASIKAVDIKNPIAYELVGSETCDINQESNIADSFVTLGLIAIKFEQFNEAKIFIQKAISFYEMMFGNDHKKVIDATIFLGIIAQKQEKFEEALKVFGQALRSKRHDPTEYSCSGDIFCSIGQVQLDMDHPRLAFHSYTRALQCYEKAFGCNEVYAETLVIVAGILAQMEKYTYSRKIFKHSLDLYESLSYDRNHPVVFDIQEHLSNLD